MPYHNREQATAELMAKIRRFDTHPMEIVDFEQVLTDFLNDSMLSQSLDSKLLNDVDFREESFEAARENIWYFFGALPLQVLDRALESLLYKWVKKAKMKAKKQKQKQKKKQPQSGDEDINDKVATPATSSDAAPSRDSEDSVSFSKYNNDTDYESDESDWSDDQLRQEFEEMLDTDISED
ncbi:uncharacterized protein RJT20DRAFT_134436 [Scheffersomyces xylosifermentans]|uniref:uncharacterized protein n=1 Tax=Scheffersomyces xylosifermentans TaxID=1304137 RepID=UPI00315DD65C